MKKIIILIVIGTFFFTNCKAQQNVVNISEPLEAGKYYKDLYNVRANFVGIWKYTNGNKEFTLHIYNYDEGFGATFTGEYSIDKLIGNYIYKENGNTIINTVMYMPNLSSIHTPFMGITINGVYLDNIASSIIDYGTTLYNYQCESYHKRGEVSMIITNLNSGNSLQATFNITTPEEIRYINPNCPYEDPDTFTIPTDMILTKISNVPPPLN